MYLIPSLDWSFHRINEQQRIVSSSTGASYTLANSAYSFLHHVDGTHTEQELLGMAPTELQSVGLIEKLVEIGVLERSQAPLKRKLNTVEYDGTFIKDLTFHLTYRCNLTCKHCYVREEFNEELKTQDLQRVIHEAAKMGLHRVHFTGGEPFLRSDLQQLINTVKEEGLCLKSIFTNGMLIEKYPNIISMIADNFDTTFYISLDGLEKSHNEFRGSNLSFQNAISSINFLQNMGLKVVINTILHKGNLKDIEGLYGKLKSLRVSRWRIDSAFLMGSWRKNYGSLSTSITEEMNMYKTVLSLWERDGKPFDLELSHLFKYLYGKQWSQSYNLDSYVCCDSYHNACVVWPNGDISPCGLLYSGHVIGNVLKKGLSDIWESEKMRYYKELKVRDVLSEKCEACKYLAACGTGCRGNSVFNGLDFKTPDPEICRLYIGGYARDFEKSV